MGQHLYLIQRVLLCQALLLVQICASAAYAPPRMEKQQQDLPCSFRRLVAKTTGDTFQQVSEIVERPLDPPSEEQVWRKCRDRLNTNLCYVGAFTLSSTLLAIQGSAMLLCRLLSRSITPA